MDTPSTFNRQFAFFALDVDNINLKDSRELRNRLLLEVLLGLVMIFIIMYKQKGPTTDTNAKILHFLPGSANSSVHMNQQTHQVVFLGDRNSYKSSIASILWPEIDKEWICTSYADSYDVTVLHNCEQVNLHIWWPMSENCDYTKDPLVQVPYATVVLIVYDATWRRSFEELKRLYRRAREINKTAHVVLVGNKIDLQRRREVTRAEAETYATCVNAKYCEVPNDKDTVRDILYHLIADLPLPGQVLEDAHHAH